MPVGDPVRVRLGEQADQRQDAGNERPGHRQRAVGEQVLERLAHHPLGDQIGEGLGVVDGVAS